METLHGWMHSPKWKDTQMPYYMWLGHRNIGRWWALTKLLKISWNMWDNRDGVRHAPNNPRQHRVSPALDTVVIAELRAGHRISHMTLWHHLDTTITILLSKLVEVKQSWLNKLIEVGWQFALAQQLGLSSSEINYEDERDALWVWISTGRF